jgi:hypothetical protein
VLRGSDIGYHFQIWSRIEMKNHRPGTTRPGNMALFGDKAMVFADAE